MSVDFGLTLVEKHPRTHLSHWMEAVDWSLSRLEGHFKSLWMTDHFIWGDQFTYEVWTVLSFLAARWPRFDIGPMVMGQNYRNPALLAKMAATLQVFSGGRLMLGVGAGWKADEYQAYHYPFPSPGVRLEQLTDTLEIIRRLWTEPVPVTYQGKHYSVFDAVFEPKPQPIPPLIVGVAGDRALAIAARYADWWNLSDAPISRYRERLNVLERHCQSIGRDPLSIRRTWFGRIVLGKSDGEIQARAASRPGKVFTTENAFVGTPAQVAAQMRAFVDIGVDYFMVDVVGLPHPDIMDMLLGDVLPAVQR